MKCLPFPLTYVSIGTVLGPYFYKTKTVDGELMYRQKETCKRVKETGNVARICT